MRCVLSVHPELHHKLSCWEVYQCLKNFKKNDAFSPQLDACMLAARMPRSSSDVFPASEDQWRAVTAFRNLARNLHLTVKNSKDISRKLFGNQVPQVAEIQLRAVVFPFDFVTLSRTFPASPQTALSAAHKTVTPSTKENSTDFENTKR